MMVDLDPREGFTMSMFKTDMTDHEFAAYLLSHNALEDHRSIGKSVQWFTPAGACAAIAFYDNAKCTREIYIVDMA